VIFSLALLLFVTAAAQFMKLLLHQRVHLRVGYMAIKTHPQAGIVNEVVVTRHAILLDMVLMGKANCQDIAGGMAHRLEIIGCVNDDFRRHKYQAEHDRHACG